MKRNNKKKGFTLVELLVVIAILAILASVTVVGYTGFTKKAKQSNVDVEAAQATEVIRGYVLAGEHKEGNYTVTYDGTNLVITTTENFGAAAEEEANVAKALETVFPDLADLPGNFVVTLFETSLNATTATIETIEYQSKDDASIKASVYPFA